jgi:hypothetical protein
MILEPSRHLVVATTVWKRPELTAAVLAHYKDVKDSLADCLELSLMAVGSEGALSREICERNGFMYHEHENEPVSYKWNAIIGQAKQFNPDGIIIVNSDDLVTANLFHAYAERLSEGFDYFGLRGTYVFDILMERLGTWSGYETSYMKYRIGEPAGCARCFSRRLLESTNWRLWPTVPKKNSSMDFWCTQFLKLHGFEPQAWTMEELNVGAIQVKTDLNITTFDRLPLSNLRKAPESWQVIEDLLGLRTVDALQGLRLDMAPRPEESGIPATHLQPAADQEPVYRLEDLKPAALRDRTLAELRAMRMSVLAERESRL